MQFRPHRYQTQYPVTLSGPSGRLMAIVANVNERGARLDHAIGLKSGDRVGFRLIHEQVEAVVQWAAGDRAGIAFLPNIGIDQIDIMRARLTGHRPAQPRHVGATGAF